MGVWRWWYLVWGVVGHVGLSGGSWVAVWPIRKSPVIWKVISMVFLETVITGDIRGFGFTGDITGDITGDFP